jgi:hypothetical protein
MSCNLYIYSCLVVSTPLKNMKVSWDDYSQYSIWKHKIHVPDHQPDILQISTPICSSRNTEQSAPVFSSFPWTEPSTHPRWEPTSHPLLGSFKWQFLWPMKTWGIRDDWGIRDEYPLKTDNRYPVTTFLTKKNTYKNLGNPGWISRMNIHLKIKYKTTSLLPSIWP